MTQMTMFGVRGERLKVRRPRRDDDGRGRHSNSLEAHEALCSLLTGRRAQIVGWLAGNGPATDREIATGLFGPNADMNMVRPRVTELLDAGALREADRVRDEITGMTVRRVALTGLADRKIGETGEENEA